MHREDLRPVRLQLELLKPELRLQEEKISSTVVVFAHATGEKPDQSTSSASWRNGFEETRRQGARHRAARAKRLLAKSSTMIKLASSPGWCRRLASSTESASSLS